MNSGESKSGMRLVHIRGTTPVTDATNAARDFAVEKEVARGDLSRLCVIVEELFANLYEHGGVAPDDLVEMSLSTGPDGMRIIVIDTGRPFDPRNAKPRMRRRTRGGGAGINIVRSWASHVDYRVSNGRNCLEVLIPFHIEGPEHDH